MDDINLYNEVSANLIEQFSGKKVLIKYGGNAMLNNKYKKSVIADICFLKNNGVLPVIVHGGGPFIKNMLSLAGIKSEFVDGHRKTTPEALRYIEMVLKGGVNSELVKLINDNGKKAVGLSGKDGKMVTAVKRLHTSKQNGKDKKIDLEQVGDVSEVSTSLIDLLTKNDYIPVIASIATGHDKLDYNINADMFAGHIAGAIKAKAFIAMTDVDGLLENPEDRNTLIAELNCKQIENIKKNISGGMIPKIDACLIALDNGVETARIINGTSKHSIIYELFTKKRTGTLIKE